MAAFEHQLLTRFFHSSMEEPSRTWIEYLNTFLAGVAVAHPQKLQRKAVLRGGNNTAISIMSDTLADLIRSLKVPLEKKHTVFSRSTLSDISQSKLLEYQKAHVIRLVNILAEKKVALDASDTGVGKTYMAAAVCLEMGRRPIVICPKSLIYVWKEVFALFGIEAYDIVNYETIKMGRTYRDEEYSKRCRARYVRVVDDEDAPYTHTWHTKEDAIVIVDEAHRCRNYATRVGKFLYSMRQLREKKIPLLMLSATIAEKFEHMQIPCVLFGLVPGGTDPGAYKDYIREARVRHRESVPKDAPGIPPAPRRRPLTERQKEIQSEYAKTSASLVIHLEIKDYCSRLRIKELGDLFPSNLISLDSYYLENYKDVAEAYIQLEYHLQALRDNPGGSHLGEIVRIRRMIEMEKVPIFVEQAQKHLEDGKSVIIFVNYLDTMKLLQEQLDINCVVKGGQTIQERDIHVGQFQSNLERVIILQVNAGGTGISLHDLHGGHPRVSIISCPESAGTLVQALGRAARAKAKTPVLQYVIFTAGVQYEDQQRKNLRRKMSNISGINDYDLDGFKYRRRVAKRKD